MKVENLVQAKAKPVTAEAENCHGTPPRKWISGSLKRKWVSPTSPDHSLHTAEAAEKSEKKSQQLTAK